MGIPPANPNARTVRWIHIGLASMHFLLVGMLLYFRLGPFQRVMDRLQEQGTEVPDWISLVFTLGPGLILVFLLFRGIRLLRRGLSA